MRNALIALVLLAAAALAGAARAEILEQILVKVNGEIFTKTDLEERQIQALRQRNRGVTAEDLKNDAALRQALDEITPQILAEAIDEMLILQRGRELGYRLSDEQFANIVQSIRKENKLEDEDQFQAALKQEGLTLADLRRNLERQMIFSQVQRVEVLAKIAISEAEAKAYYDAHATEFTTPATVALREILVEVEPATSPTGEPLINVGREEEAEARARALRARVIGGEDFAKVAAAESAAASKANGGLIGPIAETELAPALQTLLAGMKPGEVSEPVRTARGYLILKLESRTPTTVLPFEQAREQIADKVFQEKRQGELQKYLAKLRAQAIIEWKSEEARKLYERHVKAGASPEAVSP